MVEALGGGIEALPPLLERMARTKSNKEFLATLNRPK